MAGMSETQSAPSKVNSEENSSRSYPFAPLMIVLFLALLGWILWGATSHIWAIWAGAIEPNGSAVPAKTSAAGAWGDSFGGFNALVGAIGTSAVAATLYLQYRALEEQKKDQHLSRFEENFFILLELVRSLRSDLVYEQTSQFIATGSMYAKQGKHTSHAAIESAYNEINYWVFKKHEGRPKIKKSMISAQYHNYVHSRFEYCFSPYFRIIYTILNKIREDKILSHNEKYYYSNILRSQLTSFEIGLMAFNATSQYSKDLSDLITEFRFLKYLPQKRRKVLGDIYDKKAYEART